MELKGCSCHYLLLKRQCYATGYTIILVFFLITSWYGLAATTVLDQIAFTFNQICMRMNTQEHIELMDIAFEEAKKSFLEGGVPVGSVLALKKTIISTGHNRRVQNGDPLAHGEMDCFRNAGRRSTYSNLSLYTTLSPCMMCAGTIVQFGIGSVIIGDDINYQGNIDFLKAHGVQITILNDPKCISLMRDFISSNPSLWNEDIGKT